MAATKKKARAAGETTSTNAEGTPAPLYLPTAHPPQKRPLLLMISGGLLLAWLVTLIYLAFTAGHFR